MPAVTMTATVGRAAAPHTFPNAAHAKQHMPCCTAWRPAPPKNQALSCKSFGCSKYDNSALYTSDDSVRAIWMRADGAGGETAWQHARAYCCDTRVVVPNTR
eukprot:220122-Chlamydomonas_euryale.AAC.1